MEHRVVKTFLFLRRSTVKSLECRKLEVKEEVIKMETGKLPLTFTFSCFQSVTKDTFVSSFLTRFADITLETLTVQCIFFTSAFNPHLTLEKF